MKLHLVCALLGLALAGCAVAPPAAPAAPVERASSARVTAAAPEDCASGGDEDGDGLADCEDGDCAAHPSCVEVCTGGVDEDNDGATDCLDDECWADCAVTVRSRVTSGVLDLHYRASNSSAFSPFSGFRYEGSAWSLSGSVSLVGSFGTVACGWRVPSVAFSRSWLVYWSSTSGTSTVLQNSTQSVAPYSASLSGGCSLPVEASVLPPALGPGAVSDTKSWRQVQVALAAEGQPWLRGTAQLGSMSEEASSSGAYEVDLSGQIPALLPTTVTWSR